MAAVNGTIHDLLCREEDEHLEFKEAKQQYSFDRLVKYCTALANEGGGRFVLGISDERPRKVTGTSAFPDLQRTASSLIERLRLRIRAEEAYAPEGRVVIFHVPSRPVGLPIDYRGGYWMRRGQDLVPMTADMLKDVFNEAKPDFSGEICPSATLADLDTDAIAAFRRMWMRKSGNATLETMPVQQLLSDAELLVRGAVTYAALILLGSKRALSEHLAQAEVVFEYRATEASAPYMQRREFREGFFLFYDALWELINARNEVQQFQDGLFMKEIPSFNESVVREGLLNAISHRDYRLPGSVFIRQFPRALEIISPGGFPPGVTAENILWRQSPRNRRIAETLARCGFVERSGQGANRMFEQCVRESKPTPDFTGSDEYQVALTLKGQVQDPAFLKFLEKVGSRTLSSFNTEDFLVLDCIHGDRRVPEQLKPAMRRLAEQGVIETVGRGKGVKCLLSRQLYESIGKRGVYTRKRGLDWETNKRLLLQHIRSSSNGSRLKELMQVLPALGRSQVQRLIKELKAEGLVHHLGRTKAAKWFPGPEA